ncbi:hypothetical protein ACO0LL_14145 [Undibacterium sp. TC4M20W]|uniref:hypothetical protein n=1 Tax=Undibacterium sp. TC4M20W TaxID=3413052 RepID=UPI003BF318A9
MSAHYLSLTLCSLLMYAQYACAQEARLSVSRESAGQQMSRATGAVKEQAKEQAVTKEQAIAERDAGAVQELAASRTAVLESGQSGQPDLNGPPVPPVADAQLAGRSGNAGNAQPANGSDLYTRVTREYYSQSATPARQEKPGTLSKFGLRYSQAGSDHLWLEYRFSDKGALRLRGAAHRGVRVLAVFEYW